MSCCIFELIEVSVMSSRTAHIHGVEVIKLVCNQSMVLLLEARMQLPYQLKLVADTFCQPNYLKILIQEHPQMASKCSEG